jgi:hypothetical protein
MELMLLGGCQKLARSPGHALLGRTVRSRRALVFGENPTEYEDTDSAK